MKKEKAATFDQLIADSEPTQRTVNLGSHKVVVQELSGRDRFELAERQNDTRWELLVWVCMRGMVDPKPDKTTYIEKMRPEWVVQIATAITDISGISEEAIEEAGEGFADESVTGGTSHDSSVAPSAKPKVA